VRTAKPGGAVLDAGLPEAPLLAELHHRPWYDRGTRRLDRYARLDDTGRRISLYRVWGRARTYGPPPRYEDVFHDRGARRSR
jgi:hypothetical protein